MKETLLVEVIAHAPTAYFHCTHCEVAFHEVGATRSIHQEQLNSSLPADLQQEFQKISIWAEDLSRHYPDRLAIQVIDAASLEGVVKSLKYGIHRYPAVIVNRQSRFNGQALERASAEITHILEGERAA